jgi:hypothetical protein
VEEKSISEPSGEAKKKKKKKERKKKGFTESELMTKD